MKYKKSNTNFPSGKEIIMALKAAEVKEIIAVPDIVTSENLLWPISSDNYFRLTRVCKEDEGVSICAAMSYNGTRALLLMQQTGLMDSLNAIRAIGVDYERPIVAIVGMQGKEPEKTPEKSSSYGVRIIRPVLDSMAVSNSLIDNSADVKNIPKIFEQAYSDSKPYVFLLGKSPKV